LTICAFCFFIYTTEDGSTKFNLSIMHVAELFVVLAVLFGAQGETIEAVENTGAFECPCLQKIPPLARTALDELGYPPGFGKLCKPHDENVVMSGCQTGNTNMPSYCTSPWCYVDSETCGINKEKCIADGGVIGSLASPYCRSRTRTSSPVLDGILNTTAETFYSYDACGYSDTYDSSVSLSLPIQGHNIHVALSEWAPWVYPLSSYPILSVIVSQAACQNPRVSSSVL